MASNERFLQILRNFAGTSRADAISKLQAAANSDSLYHAGTPIVAFYQQSASPKGESMTFATRSAAKTYGNDTTLNYQALLGIMGSAKGLIEIFDLQTSVEAILGGATEVSSLSNGVQGTGKTWDFRSLGGIQVVIEEMDEVIATSLTNLNTAVTNLGTRVTNLTGQSGSNYVAPTAASAQNPNGAHYVDDATSLQDAVNQLDAALYSLSGTVSANSISNSDGSITVTPGQGDTDVHVNFDSSDHVLALDSTDGLYTDISIKKVVTSGNGSGSNGAPADDEVVGTLGTNVKDAYQLIGTDGTQLGKQINIYKDSSLKEVYLGSDQDTQSNGTVTKYTYQLKSGQTAPSGSGNYLTDAQYTALSSEDKAKYEPIDAQSLNFLYELADGTYSLVKIDVSKFLTESEFGDGLSVSNAGVVSVNAGDGLEIDSTTKAVEVKIDSQSDKVYTTYNADGTTTGQTAQDVLTVSSGGLAVNNVQAAINAKVAAEIGKLDVSDTAVAGQYVSQVSETDGKISVSRANVADAVLTGYAKGNAPTSGNEAVAATDDVKTAIAKLEHQVDAAEAAASGAVAGLDGTATASNVAAGTDTTPTADFTVLTKVGEENGVVQEVAASGTYASKSVLLKKLAATGAAADVSYSNSTSSLTATTVQAAIDEVEGRVDTLETTAGGALQSISAGDTSITVGNEDANHDQTVAVNFSSASDNVLGLDSTNGGVYLTNIWDCGTY